MEIKCKPEKTAETIKDASKFMTPVRVLMSQK